MLVVHFEPNATIQSPKTQRSRNNFLQLRQTAAPQLLHLKRAIPQEILMLFNFASLKRRSAGPIQLPRTKQKTVAWLPQLGDIFPNFHAHTTNGEMQFWDWAEGSWVYYFSQPIAGERVCTSEILEFAKRSKEFNALNVKLLALTGSDYGECSVWLRKVREMCGFQIDYPIIADPEHTYARPFGMTHASEDVVYPIRRGFIIAPDLKVRMITDNPSFMRRDPREVLRAIKALQTQENLALSEASKFFPTISPEKIGYDHSRLIRKAQPPLSAM